MLERSKLKIASDVNTSEEVLVELAKDNSYEVRTAVADNKSTPEETLYELLEDDFIEVREAAYFNLYA